MLWEPRFLQHCCSRSGAYTWGSGTRYPYEVQQITELAVLYMMRFTVHGSNISRGLVPISCIKVAGNSVRKWIFHVLVTALRITLRQHYLFLSTRFLGQKHHGMRRCHAISPGGSATRPAIKGKIWLFTVLLQSVFSSLIHSFYCPSKSRGH